MWIGNVLADNEAGFASHLSFGTNYFYAFAARASRWLHNVHQFVARTFSLNAELSEVLRKNISLGAEIEVIAARMYLLRPLNVLPHQILPANLETLREVIYLLILRGSFQLLRLAEASPEDVPF